MNCLRPLDGPVSLINLRPIGSKSRLILVIVALVMTGCKCSESSGPEAKVARSTCQFGLGLMNNLSPDEKENIIISPLSLQNALNMLLLGTADDSASSRQLIKLLGYESLVSSSKNETCSTGCDDQTNNQNRLKPHEAMRSVLQAIHQAAATTTTSNQTDPKPPEEQLNFTLANMALINKDMIKLKADYEQELKGFYEAQLDGFTWNEKQGFVVVVGESAGANSSQLALHEHANKWVSSKTNGLIKDLASEADFKDRSLVMVLLNAAHFKGRWLRTFDQRSTEEILFYNNGLPGESKSVKFMRQTNTFKYADFGRASMFKEINRHHECSDAAQTSQQSEEQLEKSVEACKELNAVEKRQLELAKKLDCSVLELAFSINFGEEFSMVILLPVQRDGLGKLRKALDPETLNEVIESLEEQRVEVEVPKFSFEATYDAKAILQKMGLSSIFDVGAANLTRMFEAGGAQTKVDKIVHKAKILVDESGAEAAAGSMATVMLRNFVNSPSPRFIADHPFFFLIRSTRSNMPLFMGCVNKF